MKLEEKIQQAVEAPLESRGYDLVRIKILGNKRLILSIDIDRSDGNNVTVEDCVNANQLISAILDVEDFIKGAYNLEVSSPGENRPLTKIRDYQRFRGQTAKMELISPIEGRLKISGEIGEVDEGKGVVKVSFVDEISEEKKELEIPLENIKKSSVKRKFK